VCTARGAGKGDDDKDAEEEEEDIHILDSIDGFIHDPVDDAALADHPELVVSPVMLYNLKKSKEEMRVAQRRATLSAEGLSLEEVQDQLDLEAAGGSGGGAGGKMNALALLISVGACVEPSAGGGSAERVEQQERRRRQRNVDQYLLRAHNVERFKADPARRSRRSALGGKARSAHEIANETGIERFGGGEYARGVRRVHVAKTARKTFRVWQRTHGASLPRPSDEVSGARRAATPAGLDPKDIEALQKEFKHEYEQLGVGQLGDEEAGEEEDEEYEDGDEGEEGEEGDQSEDLAA
jgi:hypothetical protein